MKRKGRMALALHAGTGQDDLHTIRNAQAIGIKNRY
jgi:hypothetical protein